MTMFRQPIIAGALLVQCMTCGLEQWCEDRMVSLHVCDCGGRCFVWNDTAVVDGHHVSPQQRAARERAAKAWAA